MNSLQAFHAEFWLARRLDLSPFWDAGITTREQRRERLAAAVAADPTRVVGKREGNPVTAEEALQTLEETS